MSLRSRLQSSFVILALAVISTLTTMHFLSVANNELDDVRQRAGLIAEQAQVALLHQEIKDPTAYQAALQQYLLKLYAADEISVWSKRGTLLASTAVQPSHSLQSFDDWQRLPINERIYRILFKPNQRLAIATSPGSARPYTQIVVSTGELRRALVPELKGVSIVATACLLAAALLSILFCNVALGPLQAIGRRLDEIAAGQNAGNRSNEDFESKELALVDSKLSTLSHQYNDAREHVIRLQRNVDSMLQRLEEAVLLFDSDRKLVMAGRPAERLLGRPQRELVGLPMDDIFPPYTPQGRAIQAALQQKEPLRDFAVTLDRHGLPGARVLLNLDPPDLEATWQSGAVVTLRDAATRRELESQLDVSSRLAALSRLTGGLSHEMKNPLNSIALYIEVLRSKLGPRAQDVQPEITVMQREIARLDQVVKTFAEFTKPVGMQYRETDLGATVHDICGEARMLGASRQIQFVCNALVGNTYVLGDVSMLREALLHLVRNSIEASKPTSEVEVRLEAAFDECVLVVSDSGEGIPPDIQDRIFNLFFTTKPAASGIGLSRVFQIVQLHNGKIDYSSELGQGTSFRLRFPIMTGSPLPAENRYRQAS